MPRQSPRKRKTVVETTTAEVKTEPVNDDASADAKPTPTKTKVAKRKAAAVIKEEAEDEAGDEDFKQEGGGQSADERADAEPAKKKRKRASKLKPSDIMPLAARTAIASLKKAMYIGAHVSAAGGVQNSVSNAVHIGANAWACFLKSQKKWVNPPLAVEARDGFAKLIKEHLFEANRHCLPHGSYLVNLAAAEKAKADQAYDAFLDDLQRCEQLGIRYYNFHPGNSNGHAKAEAIARIAGQLNKAHKATKTVVTVLENMACEGNVVGSAFEELRDIIKLVEDKSRVGVCLDTCHAFAAGYDFRSPEAFQKTMEKFDSVIGKEYLKALHMNDSKAPLGGRRDLHANIGTGFLGLRGFHNIMNHEGFEGLPMVLETPIDRKGEDGKTVEDKQIWADEIKLLESLIGMDIDGEEFKRLDEKLQARGASERAKIQEQVDRKAEKGAKKGSKKSKKQSKLKFKNENEDEEDSD